MKKGEQEFVSDLITRLDRYSLDNNRLHFASADEKIVLARQIRDSIRRIDFIRMTTQRPINSARANPSSNLFDPIRASSLHLRGGNFDEACWLIFIATQFGKHSVTGWDLARQVYGRLGAGEIWNWQNVSVDLPAFRRWMISNEQTFVENMYRWKFSNHRKYQSMKVGAPSGTLTVFETYVRWVMSYGGHADLFRAINRKVGQNPFANFDYLFNEMTAVKGFGRLAKFDHLTMLSKVGIIGIEPGSPYLEGATGPRAGAAKIFNMPNANASVLNNMVIDLGDYLNLGMQVMEDSLCNWQKSSGVYVLFSG